MSMLRRILQGNVADVNNNDGADELAGVTVLDTENNVLEYEDGTKIDCDAINKTVVQKIHCKIAFEQDGNDADGTQGGQKWQPPTKAPTPRPTTSPPTTLFPTSNTPTETSDAPTPRGDPFILRGLIWYDKNGNGKQDSNINDSILGLDVERNLGLGGVQIQLTECDPRTNMALSVAQANELYTDGSNSYASTISSGYNIMMHAMLIHKNDGGGKFELTNIRVARSYYIQVSAPMGYLFTGGVCNDDIAGWECPIYNLASNFVSLDSNNNNNTSNTSNTTTDSYNRRRQQQIDESAKQITNPNAAEPSDRDLDIGIRVGRSSKCVSIDAAGVPESRFDDLGVMRIGDLRFDETDVSLGVNMADVRRELLLHSRILDSHRKKIARDDGRYVYELADREAESIGEVTAEVIASRLDKALEENGGVLDSVSHMDVTYYALDSEVQDDTTVATTTSSSSKTYSSRSNGRLEVNLKVRGHYTSDRNIDFDYIVEDSINRESSNIRTQMTSYNQQCNDQTAKITNEGYTVDDFSEVQSNYGIQEKRRQREQVQQQQNTIFDVQGDDERLTWSTACEKKRELPQFVEENLEALQARVIAQTTINDGGMSPWTIVGIVLGVGVLAFGCVVFLLRRNMTTKKRRETEWDEWSNDADTTDKKIKYANNVDDYKKSQPTGITGVVQHKVSNMTSALRSEFKRFRSGDDDSTIFNNNNVASVRSSRSRGTNAKDHIKEKGDNVSAYSNSRRSRDGSVNNSRGTMSSYQLSNYSTSSTGSKQKSTQSEITYLESSLKKVSSNDRSTTASIGGSVRSKASLAWSEYSSRGGGMNNSLGIIEEGSTVNNNTIHRGPSSNHNERSFYAIPQITHTDFDESSDGSSFAASSKQTDSHRSKKVYKN